jgi:hypothetical protein
MRLFKWEIPNDVTEYFSIIGEEMMGYPHWQYFLAIESDLEATSRFVEFSRENFATYSIEFTRLLLSCGSEVDVVAKALCQKIEPNGTYKNINDYRTTITNAYGKFSTIEVSLPRYGLVIQPWKEWSVNNPSWWTSYNNVKHYRDTHFKEANLENALLSIGGLFTLVLYCYHEHLSENNFHHYPKLMLIPNAPEILRWGEWSLPDFPS